jgi:CheY-like chemotaxis protein
MEHGKGPAIPAIALTAFAREEDRDLALNAGFQLHLSKPVEPAELAEAVARLAREGVTGPVKPQVHVGDAPAAA